MIIYLKDDSLPLEEYGITIPMDPSKVHRTYTEIKAHPYLQRNKQALISRIKEEITAGDLLRVHTREYVNKLYSKSIDQELIKTYELLDDHGNLSEYYIPEKAKKTLNLLFPEILLQASATYLCCKSALSERFCFFLGGGMHHAKTSSGDGFCLINDVVIAVRKLQYEKLIERVWIIDLDAHKGDGTAEITQDDDSIITLSIHMAEGWPLNRPKILPDGSLHPSFIPSNIDIPIKQGADALYNQKLIQGLKRLDLYKKADLAVVVDGSDPFEEDELASAYLLKLTMPQMLERDKLVYGFLEERNIPAAYLQAGGYGKQSWRVYSQFLHWLLDHLDQA